MSKIFVMSDNHHFHNNIIKYCSRPFKYAEQMDECIINNINAVVKQNDELYILGDFSLSNDYEKLYVLFSRIKCTRLYLIKGNHDSRSVLKLPWIWVKDYNELYYKEYMFCMMHYPIKIWNKKHHGAICLGGHSHLKINEFKERYMDVGVDANNYTPVDLDTIIEKMKNITDYSNAHHSRE